MNYTRRSDLAYLPSYSCSASLPSVPSTLIHCARMQLMTTDDNHDEFANFYSGSGFSFQVGGYKYLRLYSRQQTQSLYVDGAKASQLAVHATRAQKNISAVNVEQPDLEKHPKFANTDYFECVLSPGDMLFIPAKHWHYVRSLSPAISVNFWY